MIKVGIAGAGLMGETHACYYDENDDAELYALAEKNNDKREGLKKVFSSSLIYDDVYKMINDDNIDLIDICLPTPLHARVAIAALERNKHVLLEKPIALNMEDAEKIFEAAKKSNGKFMVAQVLRFWPDYLIIRDVCKEIVKEENILSVYASRFNELPIWSENEWIMNEKQSGGVIVDLLIHDIDFIIWNFGKVKKVFCNPIFNKDDYAIHVMSILELESGITAYVEGGYLNPMGKGLNSQMRIYSEKTLVEMYSHENKIRISREHKSAQEIPVNPGDGYRDEIYYFIRCIKEGIKPGIVKTDEAIEGLKTCLALKQSMLQKKWIIVE